jgi:hypothetical protein
MTKSNFPLEYDNNNTNNKKMKRENENIKLTRIEKKM